MSRELVPPPRVQFFKHASGLFLGHMERNAARASGDGYEFESHLLYDKTSLPAFTIEMAGVEIDEIRLDIIKLLDERGDFAKPDNFSGLNITGAAYKNGAPVHLNTRSSYPYLMSIISGNERLPTAIPFEDVEANDFSRGVLLGDEQCTALLGLIHVAEADIYDRRGKHINR